MITISLADAINFMEWYNEWAVLDSIERLVRGGTPLFLGSYCDSAHSLVLWVREGKNDATLIASAAVKYSEYQHWLNKNGDPAW